MAVIGVVAAHFALPPNPIVEEQRAMQRRRFKQATTLNERLAAEATRLRELAAATTNDVERELLLKRAVEYEATTQMDGYLRSADLQPPT